MTSLLKPAEVHSYEVYPTFLVAGHFFSPLFHFALHTRFHWLLSRSDIAYQIKHNQQFLSSGTLTLSNPYYFIYDQHPHLFPVCLLSYSHSLLHTPSPLRGCILLKYEPYQNHYFQPWTCWMQYLKSDFDDARLFVIPSFSSFHTTLTTVTSSKHSLHPQLSDTISDIFHDPILSYLFLHL